MRTVTVCTWGSAAEAPELLTLARTVGGCEGSQVQWLVLGPLPDGAVSVASDYGAQRLLSVGQPELGRFGPDRYVEALAQCCAQLRPDVLLFSQTYDVRLIAPRLAGRLRCGVVMNALDAAVLPDGRLQVTASAYGGDARAAYVCGEPGPMIVSVMPNAVAPEPADAPCTPDVEPLAVDVSAVEERIRVAEPARAEGPRLEDAQVIVAGGRGLGNASRFTLVEQLAEVLGGVAGASRPIVDDGWADPSRQVGLTGKITRPALYIAAGISGASQHMAGCSAAKTIVAINRDPDAAIFRYARFGAVGDCLEIIPEMIQAIEAR